MSSSEEDSFDHVEGSESEEDSYDAPLESRSESEEDDDANGMAKSSSTGTAGNATTGASSNGSNGTDAAKAQLSDEPLQYVRDTVVLLRRDAMWGLGRCQVRCMPQYDAISS